MEQIERPIDQVESVLDASIRATINVHLHGGSGIGKTTAIEAAAASAKRLLCPNILASMDIPDVGMCGPDLNDTRWLSWRVNKALPFVGTEDVWLHPESGNPPIIFFDEANGMQQYMMNVMQQAFLTKSIHNIPFIPGTVIMAASNRAVHAAKVSQMTGPFANRQIHINCLPPTLDGFVAYCNRKNVNQWVPAYAIHTGGEMIYEWDPQKFLVSPAFSTPRGWCTTVSDILDMAEVGAISDDDRLIMIAGQVGRPRAEDFEDYYRLRKELPDPLLICATGDGLH